MMFRVICDDRINQMHRNNVCQNFRFFGDFRFRVENRITETRKNLLWFRSIMPMTRTDQKGKWIIGFRKERQKKSAFKMTENNKLRKTTKFINQVSQTKHTKSRSLAREQDKLCPLDDLWKVNKAKIDCCKWSSKFAPFIFCVCEINFSGKTFN